jgi:hypothetical protein
MPDDYLSAGRIVYQLSLHGILVAALIFSVHEILSFELWPVNVKVTWLSPLPLFGVLSVGYNISSGAKESMIINKLLTRKGWRVVGHSLLTAAGIGLVYLLSKLVMGEIQHEDTLRLCVLGVGIAFSLWLVALGSMLIKAELTDWR